jgi:peptidoglycan-associated lipoprotein
MPRHRFTVLFLAIALAAGGAGSACKKKSPPIARPTPPPPDTDMEANRPPAPPEPVTEAPPVAVPPEPSVSSADMGSLDEINKKGILAPVFFEFDSAEMSSEGQSVLAKNAETMKQFPTWIVSIEGHCDERGTAEYNLALGERRALSVRQYLVSLGIAAERLRTVSYGKEFPFDPGHGESAWSRNRRANFVVTAK